MMKRIALILLGGLLLSAPAQAATIDIFNTGVDAAGVVVADQTVGDLHYSLTSVPSGTSTVKAITSASGFPIGPYLGDNELSRWIGPNTEVLDGPSGDYVYRTTFDLTGLDAASAVLTGRWSTDNPGTDILINGASTGITAALAEPYKSWFVFSILDGFIAGVNTLDFLVTNSGGPTALRVEISGTADISAVPVPAALPLFGTGLALLGFMGWRRKRKAASRT